MADPITEADREEIRRFYSVWTSRLLDGDLEGVVDLYTDDTVVMEPGRPALRGKAELLAFLRSLPTVVRADFDAHEIEGYGDLAYVAGTYSMTVEQEGSPDPITDAGTFIEIRRRQPDGTWLLARDIHNSDGPASNPTGGAARVRPAGGAW